MRVSREGAKREHGRAASKHGGAEREQINKTGVSERAGWQYPLVKRGSRAVQFEDYYIYIIYTPNLGSGIAVLVQEREQGRFRGSSKGVRGRSKGALREHWGSTGGALARGARQKRRA